MEYLLKEIHTSITNVETERYNENLSKVEKTHLENTLLTLRNMERSIINKKNDDMLQELSTITPSLTKLINEMESSGERLNELNVKLKRLIYIKIIGFIATIITITSFTFKDILTIRLVNVLGSFVWLVYGFYTKDHPIIIVNLSVVIIQIWGIFFLLKDRMFPPPNKNQIL